MISKVKKEEEHVQLNVQYQPIRIQNQMKKNPVCWLIIDMVYILVDPYDKNTGGFHRTPTFNMSVYMSVCVCEG